MVGTGIPNAVVTGLVTGSVVALGAIGLSLVYSIAEVPNFAHGELLMIGAYVAVVVNRPGTVPVFSDLVTSPGSVSADVQVLMGVAVVGSVVALGYMFGGGEDGPVAGRLDVRQSALSVRAAVPLAYALAGAVLGVLLVFLLPVAVGWLAVVTMLLGVVYLVGGRGALYGSWLPTRGVDPSTAAAGQFAGAGVVAATVFLLAPSALFGGILLSVVVLALLAPLQERIVFRSFRERGADLATLLIVALGVSFVLRFGTQAVFGGQNRSYQIPGVATVFGFDVPLSAAQFFDFFATGGGVTLRWINTGAVGEPATTVSVVRYSWLVVVAILVATLGLAAWAYRARQSEAGFEASQTVGPKLAGALAGATTLLVLTVGYGLVGSGSTPSAAAYSTRISLSVMRALIILVAVAMMAFLHVLLKRTKLGKAMRASSDNLDLAKVTGINTSVVMIATWIIAGVYAAIAGVLLGAYTLNITPNMGFFLLLPMFAGVILGGIGSIYGAILGSYVVGLGMDLSITVLPIAATYRVPFAFVILFVVLLIKPEGITGGR